MNRKLELLSDINKVMEAIDDHVDAFIQRGQKDSTKKELAELIFKNKDRKLKELSAKMQEKYGR